MDMQEILKLKEKYAQVSDEELKNMLSEGLDAYREGVYQLLQAEAMKRGIDDNPQQEAPEISEAEEKSERFFPIIVVVDHEDKVFLETTLNNNAIAYFFDSLSLKGHELPASLTVEESSVGKAVELLRDFKPKGGILLW